jgi:hypothetical protein
MTKLLILQALTKVLPEFPLHFWGFKLAMGMGLGF